MEYTFYIHDERYSVPTLLVVRTQSDEDAQALAVARLGESPRYRQVEVWREDVRICLLERD